MRCSDQKKNPERVLFLKSSSKKPALRKITRMCRKLTIEQTSSVAAWVYVTSVSKLASIIVTVKQT